MSNATTAAIDATEAMVPPGHRARAPAAGCRAFGQAVCAHPWRPREDSQPAVRTALRALAHRAWNRSVRLPFLVERPSWAHWRYFRCSSRVVVAKRASATASRPSTPVPLRPLGGGRVWSVGRSNREGGARGGGARRSGPGRDRASKVRRGSGPRRAAGPVRATEPSPRYVLAPRSTHPQRLARSTGRPRRSPEMQKSFTDLGLSEKALHALERAGFEHPTPTPGARREGRHRHGRDRHREGGPGPSAASAR